MTQGMRRTAWGIAIAAVVVAAAAWALLDDGEGGASFPSVAAPTTDVVASSPAARVGQTDATTLEVGAVEPPLKNDAASALRSNHPPLRVSGRALDSDGAPIAGARFTLTSTLEDATFEGVADAEGRVSFEVPGAHAARMARRTTPETLVVSAQGHAAYFTTVECGAITHLAFGDVTLAPSYNVTGRVVDAHGQPVGGAIVTSLFTTTTYSSAGTSEYDLAAADRIPPRAAGAIDVSVVTNDRGHFTVPASRYGILSRRRADLVVTAAGFAPLDVDVPPAKVTETRVLDDIVLEQGESIHGLVFTEDGTPAPGACVFVSSKSPTLAQFELVARSQHEAGGARLGDSTWWTRTDERGAYRIDNVAQREHVVRVFGANGRATRTKARPGPGPVDITLTPFEAVTYQCIDELTGAPITLTQLVAFDVWSLSAPFSAFDETLRLPAEPTDNGVRWVIDKPAGSTPTIHVNLEGYLDVARVEDGTIILRRRAQLDVRVTAEDSSPIENAKVALASFDDRGKQQTIASTYTDVDGLAALANVPAGERTFIIHAPGFIASSESITLRPGPTTRHAQLAQASQLLVHIRDADGKPTPSECLTPALTPDLYRWDDGATIVDSPSARELNTTSLALHEPPSHNTAWTGPGAFVFTGLPEGTYHLRYEPGGAANATVTKGKTTEIVMTLRRWPLASGFVASNGHPVSGAKVSTRRPGKWSSYFSSFNARPQPPRPTPESTTTDAYGRWSMPVLAGERYITVEIPSAARTESRHTFEYDEKFELVHELQAHRLRGIVLDTDGTPVSGASVVARPRGGAATTDADGRFILPWASLDVETMHASHADYIKMAKPHAVSTDKPMRLVLTRGTQVVCHFEDTHGQRLNPTALPKHTVWLQSTKEPEAELDLQSGSEIERALAARLTSAMKQSRISMKASTDGTTHIARGVPPGPYRVSVKRAVGRDYEEIVSQDIEVADVAPIEITLVVPVVK